MLCLPVHLLYWHTRLRYVPDLLPSNTQTRTMWAAALEELHNTNKWCIATTVWYECSHQLIAEHVYIYI